MNRQGTYKLSQHQNTRGYTLYHSPRVLATAVPNLNEALVDSPKGPLKKSERHPGPGSYKVKSDFDREDESKLLNIAGCLKYQEAIKQAYMNSSAMSSSIYGGCCDGSMMSY